MKAMRVLLSLVFVTFAVFVPIRSSEGKGTQTARKKQDAKPAILEQYGKLPLSFELNQGQTDTRVKFLSRGRGYSLFLTGKEAVIALKKAQARSPEVKGLRGRERMEEKNEGGTGGTVVRMELAEANAAQRLVGAEELPGKANYFIGNDPAKWRTNVPTYAKVMYEGVYPGVDLVYYGNQGRLEYDFVVAPGANPNEIHLKFRDAGKLLLDEKGELLIGSKDEEVRFEKPLVYQEVGRERKPVEGKYVLTSVDRVGFQLGAYDHSQPLVIDPVLVYSTYLGGSVGDQGNGIAVDASGCGYVAGITDSNDFPTTAGAFQTTFGGLGYNAFVTKINATGSALVYSTYLGGSGSDSANAITVDGSGNVYVTGSTDSTNFPTTAGAFQTTIGGIYGNAFVTKINTTGSALVYSTYLGGSGGDGGNAIAVNDSGNAYVTGITESTNFPTVDAVQSTYGAGVSDVFVTKFNPSGSALAYSTYLGGSNTADTGLGIAVDGSGNAYVTGYTGSAIYPTTAGAFQVTYGGAGDAFVTEIGSVPFAAFNALAEIDLDRTDSFEVAGEFTLGAASKGIDPLTEAVTLEVGTFSTTIPADSFREGRGLTFRYDGIIDDVKLNVVIFNVGGNRFLFAAQGIGANLTGTANPVTVRLAIANDDGSTTVKALIVK